MALSVFLRTQACGRILGQQALRLSQPLAQRTLTTLQPIRNLAVKETRTKATPLMTIARSFRTSMVRLSEETPHDHAKLWVVERLTSAVLVPLIPLALFMPNKILDSVLAILIVAHSHWGLEAIAVDYVRASVVGPILPKVALGLVYFVSIATLGGLFYLISHDVGIANAFKQLWAVKAKQA